MFYATGVSLCLLLSFTWALGISIAIVLDFPFLLIVGVPANKQLNYGTSSKSCCLLSHRWSTLRNTQVLYIVACYSRSLQLEGGMGMLHTLQIQWGLHLDKPRYLQKQDAPSDSIRPSKQGNTYILLPGQTRLNKIGAPL